MMKKIVFAMLLTGIFATTGVAGEQATPMEVYEMVIKASRVLETLGDDALQEFNNPTGEFVWKDSYVWVNRCEATSVAAHPIKPDLIGKNHENLLDKKGNAFFRGFCEAARDPEGGWTEYWWPKPGEPEDRVFRKISFTIQVPGRPYQVSAGIYDDSMTVEELNKSLR